ncbi:hypothetical protein ACLM5H_10930 [Fredinandcohnia humi]
MNIIKHPFLILLLFLLLVGCSDGERGSLEHEIITILNSSKGKDYDYVVDFDIKDEFIVVIYKSKKSEQLNIGFIKVSNNKLKWETGTGGPELTGGDSFILYPLIVNVMVPKDPNVKEVKVFGETARHVKYSDEIEYWISYTDTSPNSFDVEYLK